MTTGTTTARFAPTASPSLWPQLKTTLTFVAFGALFGFLLSRVGATQYDTIAGMFLLTDLHLFGVIGVAVVVTGIGFAMMRLRAGVSRPPEKPMRRGLVLGATMFGAGWALAGACPGTSLAQLGEGQSLAIFTVAGILLGSLIHRLIR